MEIDFEKGDGLVPAIIQDVDTMDVLMLGYMNEEAYEETLKTKRVTFYSRSKQRLWTKGEESGNTLELHSLEVDCDNDTLLVKARPNGPTCHTGTTTCWGDTASNQFGVIEQLESIINDRQLNPSDQSYISSLFDKGMNKIAQKVGEEAVEVVIEAKDDNEELFLNESADLLFHYLILLRAKGYGINDVLEVLKERRK
ncbi:MAG: bifunctional phosphoribosyl-AMP cyclohydrolase/phosphoribosyl-ATP diphosphatase HisIE [Bacteroidota bacterium]